MELGEIIVIAFFVVVALFFLKVKKLNKEDGVKRKRLCPYCKSEISLDATVCPYCRRKSVDYSTNRAGDKLLMKVVMIFLVLLVALFFVIEWLKKLGFNI